MNNRVGFDALGRIYYMPWFVGIETQNQTAGEGPVIFITSDDGPGLNDILDLFHTQASLGHALYGVARIPEFHSSFSP